ncbi:unnamed protein product [Cladocopium goreaui]|uniref:Secreted protein n=1 Tax=Cladocopium goreaui TaxID=2562237 RepID=A0A9P1GFA2_9DINO|nr:unnamed protein product [Cladocopium goreaui]|mmetsp:Transcript_57252/g.125280  ORF Transcript_57252/g.125280 Transcript_57252/m.125280 type:complete len:132 (+) Transcript_57252:67-462(+)
MPLARVFLFFVSSPTSRCVVAVSMVDEVAGESTVIVDAIGELLTDALQLSDEDVTLSSAAASKVHRRGSRHRGRDAPRHAASGAIALRKQSHDQQPAELLELDEKMVDEKKEASDVPRTKMMRSEHAQKHR